MFSLLCHVNECLSLTSKPPGKFSLDLIIASKVHTARRLLSLFLLLFKREKVLSTSAVLSSNAVINTLHNNSTFHCTALYLYCSLTADAPRGAKNALAQTPVHEELRRANKLP